MYILMSNNHFITIIKTKFNKFLMKLVISYLSISYSLKYSIMYEILQFKTSKKIFKGKNIAII